MMVFFFGVGWKLFCDFLSQPIINIRNRKVNYKSFSMKIRYVVLLVICLVTQKQIDCGHLFRSMNSPENVLCCTYLYFIIFHIKKTFLFFTYKIYYNAKKNEFHNKLLNNNELVM